MLLSLKGWYILAIASRGPTPVYVDRVDTSNKVAFYWRLQPDETNTPWVIHGDAPFNHLRHLDGKRVVHETPSLRLRRCVINFRSIR